MNKPFVIASALSGLALAGAALLPAAAQEVHGLPTGPQTVSRAEAEKLFNERCASCHNGSVERAPARDQLAQRAPEELVTVMTQGIMRPMAEGLNEAQINAIASYITGKEVLPRVAEVDVNKCAKADPINLSAASWNGWSIDKQNSHYQPKPGLKAGDVGKLKVKWTFAYPGSKNGQVTVIGKRLFVTSNAGKVYSLNADSGCVYWRADIKAGVRTTPIVAKNAKSPSGYAMYIGDDRMTVHALDAMTGQEIWNLKVESHPRAVITGSPTLYGDVLYQPTSSMEETVTSEAAYACCTFRGAVAAIDVTTGKQLWKTYTLDEAPRPSRVSQGKQLFGPAGGAIWSAPTIDPKRGLLYVTTGDNYTDVQSKGTDAVIAMDLKTGKVKWINQVTEKDAFIVGCGGKPETRAANCPQEVGPDHDFGSSAILHTAKNGKQVLLAGQKSGVIYAMDPDTGKTLWRQKLGFGGALGGIEWGIAADQDKVYAPVADQGVPMDRNKAGLYALNVADGKLVWQADAVKPPKCSWQGRCGPGFSAAVTVIPGAVFSGSLDGHLRAFDTATGAKLWDFDTAAQPYKTVNGKDAKGGAIDATAPVIVDGVLYQHVGYSGYAGSARGENVLIAFSPDGK